MAMRTSNFTYLKSTLIWNVSVEMPASIFRIDHDRKIRSRKQRTDVGKYSFVNRTIKIGTIYLQTY
jgi:hypothetical protein